jgi:hypothetical protein
MNSRQPANLTAAPLLDLIERRFDLRLPNNSIAHLRSVHEHYMGKRQWLLWKHGVTEVLQQPDYAKAVLISEAARLILREIDPWPRRKNKKGTS